MRTPRNIDAELLALAEKARTLKSKRVTQLGELVVVTGADALDLETLAGSLIATLEGAKSEATREAWRDAGKAFFLQRGRGARAGKANGRDPQGAAGDAGGAAAG